MSRFGAQGPGGTTSYFGQQDEIARVTINVSDVTNPHQLNDPTYAAIVTSADLSHGHQVSDPSIDLTFSVLSMTHGHQVSNPNFGQIITTVDVDPVTHPHVLDPTNVTRLNPTITQVNGGVNPRDNETGVVIDGINFGTLQGTVSYGSFPSLNVTNWQQRRVTVTWAPIFANGGSTGFELDYELRVTRAVADDGVASDPALVQTDPQAAYQYLQPTEQPADPEGIWNDDTLTLNEDYAYGIEVPQDGQWDFSNLASGYLNNVPNGGVFQYRLWDVSTGVWSGTANETFTVQGAPPVIGVGDLSHAHQLSDPGYVLNVSVNDLLHNHGISDPTPFESEVGVQELRHFHNLTQPTVVPRPNLAVGDVDHPHQLQAASLGNLPVTVNSLQNSHFLTQPSVIATLQVGDMNHAHTITQPTASFNDPPVLTVPVDRLFVYPDPPGTGLEQADPSFQAWLNSATAFDDEDGDITGSITTNEDALPWPVTEADGPQTVTWTVTDSAGQTVQESRFMRARPSETPSGDGAASGVHISISLEI
jgi:hypothetical protein